MTRKVDGLQNDALAVGDIIGVDFSVLIHPVVLIADEILFGGKDRVEAHRPVDRFEGVEHFTAAVRFGVPSEKVISRLLGRQKHLIFPCDDGDRVFLRDLPVADVIDGKELIRLLPHGVEGQIFCIAAAHRLIVFSAVGRVIPAEEEISLPHRRGKRLFLLRGDRLRVFLPHETAAQFIAD